VGNRSSSRSSSSAAAVIRFDRKQLFSWMWAPSLASVHLPWHQPNHSACCCSNSRSRSSCLVNSCHHEHTTSPTYSSAEASTAKPVRALSQATERPHCSLLLLSLIPPSPAPCCLP
jgi:hypothetical protein